MQTQKELASVHKLSSSCHPSLILGRAVHNFSLFVGSNNDLSEDNCCSLYWMWLLHSETNLRNYMHAWMDNWAHTYMYDFSTWPVFSGARRLIANRKWARQSIYTKTPNIHYMMIIVVCMLWLVMDCIISRYNHSMQADYSKSAKFGNGCLAFCQMFAIKWSR